MSEQTHVVLPTADDLVPPAGVKTKNCRQWLLKIEAGHG
jgi:hypothetical protein